MSELLLATLNARFAHASFGLRYLLANLGELREHAELLELEIATPRDQVLGAILERNPQVLALGVYIWNVRELTAVVADLKQLRPELLIVLGGPEVSHEAEAQEIVQLADYTLQGEADLAFAGFAGRLLAGERPAERIHTAPLPDLATVRLPYEEYTDADLAQGRVVYVEASRGCPFRCAFCLSSLPDPVRQVPLDAFLSSMQRLLQRGARNFKFVDRTFNLSARTCAQILEFFLERLTPDLHLHFELIPDRLPAAVRELTRRFPPGQVQFEVGIQTFTPDVNANVSRKQDDARAVANLEFLRDETDVHVHADLLFGLPGETLTSFGESFDRLLPLVPGDIQLGVLKRIRGTPIQEGAGADLVFSRVAPYELLRSATVSHAELQRVKRLAQTFERFRNRDDLPLTLELLTLDGSRVQGASPRPPRPRGEAARAHPQRADGSRFQGASPRPGSAFAAWLAFSDWLHGRVGHAHSLSAQRRIELLWAYLTEARGLDPAAVAKAIHADVYEHAQGTLRLRFLEAHFDPAALSATRRRNRRLTLGAG